MKLNALYLLIPLIFANCLGSQPQARGTISSLLSAWSPFSTSVPSPVPTPVQPTVQADTLIQKFIDEQLVEASTKGDDILVKELIAKGAKVKVPADFSLNALQHAAMQGHAECLRLLLATGTDLTVLDSNKNTLLHLAARSGNADCINLLITARCNSKATNTQGDTPLHCAASSNRLAAIEALLAAGADATAINNEGNTTLHSVAGVFQGSLPCQCGRVSHDHNKKTNNDLEAYRCMKALLNAGADASASNNEGRTPLHCAAANGQERCAKLLCKKQDDINERDNLNGATALHYANEGGYTTCADSLIKAGADGKIRNKKGQTALSIKPWWVLKREHEQSTIFTLRNILIAGIIVGTGLAYYDEYYRDDTRSSSNSKLLAVS